MTSIQPLWWAALPLLLLPLWWHLQKRERTRTDLLATARFLPAAAPRQQRVARLADVLLLLLRLALLTALIAWLAVLVMPWRGDTVFVAAELESDPWSAQQVAAAGLGDAQRVRLPDDPWNWLARNEHAWRTRARLLVLARQVDMPALPPTLAHGVELRLAPSPAAPAAQPCERHVTLATTPERAARWQALFAAFGSAGAGACRYTLDEAPQAGTELIVWDRPDAAPPAAWRAPLWWRTAAQDGAPQATPQGLVWRAAAWPLDDAEGARALYEQWQRATRRPAPYAMAAQALPAARSAPLPSALARSPDWLALALVILFALERMLTHVRRR